VERRKAHVRLIKVLGGDGEADAREQLRHHGAVAHVAVDEVRDLDILEPRYGLHGPQTSDRLQASGSGAEKVPQHPVVGREAVHESPADDAARVEPRLAVGRERRAEEVHVLDDAVCASARELEERVEDDTRAERETDERGGADAHVALDQHVGEHEARGLGAVHRVGPWVVNEVAELGEHCR
jgi:hypothetical protein